jgi:ribonuclease E
MAQSVVGTPPAAPAIEHAPAIERAPVMEQPPAVERAPVVEAAPAPTPRPAPRPAPEPVHVDTRAMLEVAGLQMVETVRSSVPPVPPEEPQVQLGRPRRERPRPTEEPLQQVETKT